MRESLRLMIVDDSNIIRRKIQRECNSGKYNVVYAAKNGADAINAFSEVSPQVVTMDLTMPQMDGIECVSKMVAMDPNVRILVVSALSDVETGIEALEKGARGFLCKPFGEEKLNSALADLTEGMHV